MNLAVSPRENWVKIDTTAAIVLPNAGNLRVPGQPDAFTLPHFTVPSFGPGGHLVQGFSLVCMVDTAEIVGANFVDGGPLLGTLWRLLPAVSRWAKFADLSMEMNEEWMCYDIGAGASFYLHVDSTSLLHNELDEITGHGKFLLAITPLI